MYFNILEFKDTENLINRGLTASFSKINTRKLVTFQLTVNNVLTQRR
ncbi:hypothetical protein KL86DYS1_10234 [uncultured Dysgonomonas sp.]|uniref:Uncharacterized protein n=1 Tax=uncultured Dysgonomonas sp. TaxID=206096 RepID=A0A212IV61_9BACT|nr:hypothetical protein KL86DYS1_10234 [uncultured Dysgonomonas sp.]